jgi:photosystem II stability/assembly factor-like uncharacterized protein
MESFIERGVGSLFLQEDPAEEFGFLTCVGVGNITIPKRARTIKYCPVPFSAGDFKPAGFVQGEAGQVSTTLTRPLSAVTVVTNYQIAEILFGSEFTSGEVEQPAVMEPGDNDRILTNGELVGLAHTFLYKLNGEKQEPNPAASTTAINDMAVMPEQCATRCSSRIQRGQIVWAALDTETPGVSAGGGDQVIYTENHGAAWNLTAFDPLTNGLRNALCILLIHMGTHYRVIVGGDTRALHPAQISYSDDRGATAWSDVAVGATNGEAIHKLTRDALGRIWVVTSAGQIYRSANLGLSWTLMYTMAAPQALRDIAFYSEQLGYAVGDAGTLLQTTDGGATWVLLADPTGAADAVLTTDTNYAGHVFLGTDAGIVLRSIDDADNFDELMDLGGVAIRLIRFENTLEYFGFMLWDNAGPTGYFHRSEDGGVSWIQQEYDNTNQGLNAIAPCGPNMAYVGGEPTATGEPYIGRYSRAAA